MEHNWFRPFLPLHCKYPSLMYSATSSPLSAKDNHSKQTYEDHLWCKGPRKTIKACHGKGRGTLLLREWLRHSEVLSSWESGHTIPFSPQDFCSLCVFVYCSHNTRSCGPGSTSLTQRISYFFSACWYFNSHRILSRCIKPFCLHPATDHIQD